MSPAIANTVSLIYLPALKPNLRYRRFTAFKAPANPLLDGDLHNFAEDRELQVKGT